MPIITISRGSYSRGKEVAERVASALGYRCISRDILLDASEEFNLPEIKLIRALHDAPSVLERFTYGKERYINYIRSALLQQVQGDNVVYHGLAGHFLLANIPHVLKVRIIADMNDRVREEMKREKISEETARYILSKDDEERRKWGIQVYGADTWDSRLYDMVLKIKTLSVEDAADLIVETARKPAFQMTPDDLKRLRDMALAARVQATLGNLIPSIQVYAEDGAVTLCNIHVNVSLETNVLEEAKQMAEAMDGVKSVVLNMTPKSEDCQHINPFYNINCK
ncbi:AAA family ATPase [Desulfatirhabdium butyrativorans]|uniref:cytidylate kinase-like family protein n=1 Tax=Desulfatirhabdium butyrativorans TaxID=340467 RepID=UPI0003F91F72|nr:cytidylate kinase-like family protein [Desulfatirhabdium butyrativorans]